MSRKFWISAVAVGLTTVSASALADHDRDGVRYDERDDDRYDDRYDGNSDYEYARVVGVQPQHRRVRVSEPVRDCWDEVEQVSDGPFSSRHIGGTLIGGLIGGVLGNQVGDGRGRQVARAAGAIIGGAVGHNVSRDRQHTRYEDERVYQRCETRYRDSWVERVDGYRVTYEYAGRQYVTQLPYDPGERIRIRVDVTPVEA